jgi:tetratricopeptide (TPR) repeat protein
MNRALRLAAWAGLGLVAAGAAVAFVLYLRGQLPRPRNASQAPQPAPAPPPREATEPAAASPLPPPPPAPRALSWENLTVGAIEGDLRLKPPVAKVLDLLDQDLLGAVKDLKDDSGLFPCAANHVVFVPVSRKEAAFREAYSVLPAKTGMRVEVPVEPLVLGWWTGRAALESALAEALLLEEVPALSKAPAWLRAGAALQLSGFGETYTRRVLLDWGPPPAQLIRPLRDSGDQAWADGYFAMRAFVAEKGDEALRRWIEAMRAGKGWEEALRSAAGESFDEFDGRYRNWAQAYLRGLCVNRQVLLDAVAYLRQEKDQEAYPLLKDFVEKQPLDLYAGNARYFLNYCRYRLGEYDRAIEGFTDLLVNASSATTWQGKAHYFAGRCYQLTGYPPLAIQQYRLAALDPDDALLEQLAQKRLKELE